MPIRLERRRRRGRVLQDDHGPGFPLSLGVGVAPGVRQLLQPRLRPRLEAGACQPLPSGRGRRRQEGRRRAGVEQVKRGGGRRRGRSHLWRRRDGAVGQRGAPWKTALVDQSRDPVVVWRACRGNQKVNACAPNLRSLWRSDGLTEALGSGHPSGERHGALLWRRGGNQTLTLKQRLETQQGGG